MSSLDYIKWGLAAKKKRWDELREIIAMPWAGDRGWEGRTIGLHLPLDLRNFAIRVQEKLALKSMKEVLFKALTIGLMELDSVPEVQAPRAPISSVPPEGSVRDVVIPPPPRLPSFPDDELRSIDDDSELT